MSIDRDWILTNLKNLNISQKKFSEFLRLQEGQVSKILRGKSVIPADRIGHISELLSQPIETICLKFGLIDMEYPIVIQGSFDKRDIVDFYENPLVLNQMSVYKDLYIIQCRDQLAMDGLIFVLDEASDSIPNRLSLLRINTGEYYLGKAKTSYTSENHKDIHLLHGGIVERVEIIKSRAVDKIAQLNCINS